MYGRKQRAKKEVISTILFIIVCGFTSIMLTILLNVSAGLMFFFSGIIVFIFTLTLDDWMDVINVK